MVKGPARFWLFVLAGAMMLGLFTVLLSFYNRYILDDNLKNLKTSLSILDTATGVGQAEAALLLVDQALVNQMVQQDVDLKALTALQFAQGALSSDTFHRPVKDAQVILQTITEEASAKRSGFLTFMDNLVVVIQNGWRKLISWPRSGGVQTGTGRMDTDRLQEAIRAERLGSFDSAIKSYEALLRDYPDYRGHSGLKLRLAYLYERTQLFEVSERLYREIMEQAELPKEAQVARTALERLRRSKAGEDEIQVLERRFQESPMGIQRQVSAFELGGKLIQRQSLRKAAETFHQAYLALPQGKLALPSKFKEGWCWRILGRLEEAFDAFYLLIRQDPKSQWAYAAYSQMAEAYKATGDHAAAAQVYEQILTHAQDDSQVATALAQAGSTYLFDLKSPQKAQVYFDMLTIHFPGSALGAKGQVFLETKPSLALTGLPTDQKGAGAAIPYKLMKPPLPITPPEPPFEGTPAMQWLSEFVPLFADVLSKRLAEYMAIAGMKEFTREFTEAEFQELVSTRIHERFSDQITNVRTRISPNGFLGSGTLRLGPVTFPVSARVGIKVVGEKPTAVLHEVKIGNLNVPAPMLRNLEKKVNADIERTDYPLKVKRYELKQGEALITVEAVR